MIITEAVVTVLTLLWPGAINALFGQAYSIKSSWGVSRVFFEWVTLGSLAVMIALGLAFWGLGESRRRAGLLGIAVTVQGTPERERDRPPTFGPPSRDFRPWAACLTPCSMNMSARRERELDRTNCRGDPGVAPES